ncbi:MAG: beta strand repeat-containing protein, partial [Hyphomicrobium sp.]
ATIVNNVLTFNPGTAFNHLAPGATQVVTIGYSALDVHGLASTAATISITVTGGANAAPSINAGASMLDGNVVENDTPTANGSLIATDAYIPGGTLSYSGDAAGSYGTFAVNEATGTWSYTLGAAAEGLANGEIVSETFDISVSDGALTATDSVSVIITGINDDPTAADDSRNASANGPPVTIQLIGDDIDSDDDAASLQYVLISAPPGASLSGRTLTYNPAGQFPDLPANQTADVTVIYKTIDGNGGESDPATVTITVSGTNQPPVLTVIDASAAFGEDNAVTLTDSGSFSFTDADVANTHTAAKTLTSATLSSGRALPVALSSTVLSNALAVNVATAATGGTIGNVTWTFSLASSAVQFLAEGEQLSLNYSVSVADNIGAGDTETVTVILTGSNDGPVISVVDATGSITEDQGAGSLTENGTLTFADVDLADVHTVSATAGTSTRGTFLGALSATKTSDTTNSGIGGGINWLYTVNNAALQELAAGETVTETFNVSVNDSQPGGTASQVVTVTLSGVNDAPLLGTIANVTLDENVSQAWASLNGSDVDGDGLIYAIVGGIDAALFGINAATGALSFLNAPDFEAADDAGSDHTYNVSIAVGDGTVSSAAQAVAITIRNVDGQSGTGQAVADTFTGTSEADAFSGGGANDAISGAGGNDELNGDAGSDVLDGGAGNDRLDGGAGNDTLIGGEGDDTFVIRGSEALGDTMTAGTLGESLGDTLEIAGTGAVSLAAFSGIATGLDRWVGNAAGVIGTSGDNVFDFSDLVSVTALGSVDGAAGNDTLTGTTGADTLIGGLGADTLSGGSGNDILVGGSGSDVVNGDGGDDIIRIQGADALGDTMLGGESDEVIGDTIEVAAGTGNVSLAGFDAGAQGIERWVGNGGGIVGTSAANTLNLTGLVFISGLAFVEGSAGNDQLSGSDFSDDLRGNDGADFVQGGDGDDRLTGGAGTDTTSGGAGDDVIVISGLDAQFDTISGGSNTALGDAIEVQGAESVTLEQFTAADLGIERWLGNGFGILGTSNNNVFDLSGLSSVSNFGAVDGGSGNDTLIAVASGMDLRGGRGNDTLTGGDGADTLAGGAGTDIINGGAGNDTIIVAKLDALTDTMQGGAGTGDVLSVTGPASDNLTLLGFNSTTNGIELWSGNGGALLGTSGANTFNLSAMTTIAGLSYVDGGGGNDILVGHSGGNVLRGGAGLDIITGGGGSDTLSGGLGNDTFVFALGSGIDSITDFLDGDKLNLLGAGINDVGDVDFSQAVDGANLIVTFFGNEITLLNRATLLTNADLVVA